MRVALAALAACSLFACGAPAPAATAAVTSPTGPATSPAAVITPAPKITNVSGAVADAATWSGTVNITADTTINRGVTVTVLGGTKIKVVAIPTLTITVRGTLDIQGTSVAKVTVEPTVAKGHWNRFLIPAGGQLKAHYLVESGGGFQLVGGKVTMVDSVMSRASGDLVEGSGSFDIEYSSIGLEPGLVDSTHCDMHFNPGTNQIRVTHTNISTSVYGTMFYGGTRADFTYDNWFSNTIDIEILTVYPVSGDFSYGWFARQAPHGPGVTAHNLSSVRLPVGKAGPRP